MVISGTFVCAHCGHAHDYENFQLPPAPYSVPCEKCGEPLIESVPQEILDDLAEDYAKEERMKEQKA